jgi:hypothetical protein
LCTTCFFVDCIIASDIRFCNTIFSYSAEPECNVKSSAKIDDITSVFRHGQLYNMHDVIIEYQNWCHVLQASESNWQVFFSFQSYGLTAIILIYYIRWILLLQPSAFTAGNLEVANSPAFLFIAVIVFGHVCKIKSLFRQL